MTHDQVLLFMRSLQSPLCYLKPHTPMSYWDFDRVQATWTSFPGHRNISKVSTITKVHIVIHSCIILPPLISNVGIHWDPSFPEPGHQPETSPSPPSQHTVEPQEFSAPPPGHDTSITPANPIQHGVSPAPKPPQQSQQSQANDPPCHNQIIGKPSSHIFAKILVTSSLIFIQSTIKYGR